MDLHREVHLHNWPENIRTAARDAGVEMADDIDGFIREQRLPATFTQTIHEYYLPLAVWLAEKRNEANGPLLVGVCGGQGAGKTTLTGFLQLALGKLGWRSLSLSIDDFYLTRSERESLAQAVHPLLQTRGVPGTHDVMLGLATISRLMGCAPQDVIQVPRFDKAADDRLPAEEWPSWRGPADIVLLEGWFVGATPQEDISEPINRLEAEEDAQGEWRKYANDMLSTVYPLLFDQINCLVMLKVPGMESVLSWRTLQEQKLRDAGRGGMSDDEIARFVQHYERLTRHILKEMPERADCVLELGRDHQYSGVRLLHE